MEQPKCTFILKIGVVTAFFIKNGLSEGCGNIIYAKTESAEPKAYGRNHIFADAECCYSIRRAKVYTFIH